MASTQQPLPLISNRHALPVILLRGHAGSAALTRLIRILLVYREAARPRLLVGLRARVGHIAT